MPIPASTIVQVTPSVLSAGGASLVFNGLILSQNANLPTGAPTPFANATAVGNYFGTSSTEYAMANVYFNGFQGSNIVPTSLLFAQYPTGALAAFLRGGNSQSTLTLAAVQGIAPGVGAATTTIAPGTGTNAAYGVMTVASMTSGSFAAGQLLTGTGVTAGTRVVSQLTGTTGGAGTYLVSISQTVAATAITGSFDLTLSVDGTPKSAASLNLSAATSLSNAASLLATALSLTPATCTYSSQFNAFLLTSGTTGATSTITLPTQTVGAASVLGLTAAQGAVTSQGAIAGVPSTNMNALVALNQNWFAFTSAFEPNTANKLLFAQWVSGTNGRFLYAPWDTDGTILQNPAAYTGFGNQVLAAGYGGTAPVYSDPNAAAFMLGIIASTDFTQTNGRATIAFKTSSLVSASVSDATSAANALANGYNFYGAYATANQPFLWMYNGQVSGVYDWVDSYVNAAWLNNNIQLALMTMFQNNKSIPYNNQGYSTIKSAVQDPITAAVNFGAIRAGVTPSAAQAAAANSAAGVPIDSVLASRGWYFQVLAASAAVRAARQSPPCTLWYMDGQAVQQLNIASIDIL